MPRNKPTIYAATGKNTVNNRSNAGYSQATSLEDGIKQELDIKGYYNLKNAMAVAKSYLTNQGVDSKDFPYLNHLIG